MTEGALGSTSDTVTVDDVVNSLISTLAPSAPLFVGARCVKDRSRRVRVDWYTSPLTGAPAVGVKVTTFFVVSVASKPVPVNVNLTASDDKTPGLGSMVPFFAITVATLVQGGVVQVWETATFAVSSPKFVGARCVKVNTKLDSVDCIAKPLTSSRPAASVKSNTFFVVRVASKPSPVIEGG